MKNSLPRLAILRGLPGSGKSTLADQIYIKCCDLGGFAQHYEADQFHYNLLNQYEWRQELLEYAHSLCIGQTALALKNQLYQPSTVIVSNTTLTCNMLSPYLRLAYKLNLRNEDVHIIQCVGEFKSIHDVPEDKMEFMKERFQSNDEIKELLSNTTYKVYTNYFTSEDYVY